MFHGNINAVEGSFDAFDNEYLCFCWMTRRRLQGQKEALE